MPGRGKAPLHAGEGAYNSKVLEVTDTGDGDTDTRRPVLEHETGPGFPAKRLLFLDREFQIPGLDYEVVNGSDIKWLHSRFKTQRTLTVIDLQTGDIFMRWNPIAGDL